jgi:hypothetical protein
MSGGDATGKGDAGQSGEKNALEHHSSYSARPPALSEVGGAQRQFPLFVIQPTSENAQHVRHQRMADDIGIGQANDGHAR